MLTGIPNLEAVLGQWAQGLPIEIDHFTMKAAV
jgi:hypothetical protein